MPRTGPLPITVDQEYESLKAKIESVPEAEITPRWLITKVYSPYQEPMKMLKKILGSEELRGKSERMARARQALDLQFWLQAMKEHGWRVELTNQGKSNGHRE